MEQGTALAAKITEVAHSVEGLELVFLYGSLASGRQHPDSDVDIALCFSHEMIPNMDQVIDLAGFLSDRLNREVDLVILNKLHQY